jgi:hypothetical protein
MSPLLPPYARPDTEDGKVDPTVKRIWNGTRAILISAVSLLAICGLLYVIWQAFLFPRGEGFSTLMQEALKGLKPEEMAIGKTILTNYQEYRDNSVRWSGTYHTCLFVSAALGAFSALVLKLEFFVKNVDLKKDLAAFSATVSALLITFSTVGNFQGHWQANRLASGRIESLGYEFVTAKTKDLPNFSLKIREISIDRDQEIVGGTERSDRPPPTP